MVSREDYERVVDSFMQELQATVVGISDAQLSLLASLQAELTELRPVLQDPASSPEQLVGAAFGIVDELVQGIWSYLMAEGYALYKDYSGGQSHRHP